MNRAVAGASLIALVVVAPSPPGRPGTSLAAGGLQEATFAGGSFWCLEPAFDAVEGVLKTTLGYTGGAEIDPDYHQVSSGRTGHVEAVRVAFDPGKVSYERLLDTFWRQIDPTAKDRQFVDAGRQFRTVIFTHDESQRAAAEASKKLLDSSGRFDGPIVTEILPAGPFYPAEEYHQDYYLKNPTRYKRYRNDSGRDRFLDKVWGRGERK